MNIHKNIIIVVVFGVVVILVTWWYMTSQQIASEIMMTESQSMMSGQFVTDNQTVMTEDEEAMAALEERDRMMENEEGTVIKGGYEGYASSKLSFAQEKGNVVLFFRTLGCSSCRALDENIKDNLSQIPLDVLILSVDYDQYADLKQEYGVTEPHTLVQVNEEGTMIAKWSGSIALSDLLKQVR